MLAVDQHVALLVAAGVALPRLLQVPQPHRLIAFWHVRALILLRRQLVLPVRAAAHLGHRELPASISVKQSTWRLLIPNICMLHATLIKMPLAGCAPSSDASEA